MPRRLVLAEVTATVDRKVGTIEDNLMSTDRKDRAVAVRSAADHYPQ